jgi:hypothetical protein
MKNRWRAARVFVWLWMLFGWVPVCRAAGDWDSPATDLARQIATLAGPGTVSLSIRNNSSISADDVPAIRRALLKGLSGLGVTVAGAESATMVRVTLSQTAQKGLWVAEVQQGSEVRVAMVTVANSVPAVRAQETPVLLRKALLIVQTEPVLDAEFVALAGDAADAKHLVVLSPEQIAIYGNGGSGGAWVKGQSFAIEHGRAYPRDVRGRVQAGAGGVGGVFKTYLPGVVCSGSEEASAPGVSVVRLAVRCADSDDPWPMGSRAAFYNSSRNFFTGVTVPSAGGDGVPFFSAAELNGSRGAAIVYSETGGQVRVWDGRSIGTLAGARDWGSDVAGVQSGCGWGAQLLVTASGDATQDSLLAYEVEGREAIAASVPLPLDGEVSALWPGNESARATVVLQRGQPLQYEAYSVSLVCNQ